MNDIVNNKDHNLALWTTNPIPTIWAKLVHNSFAKNGEETNANTPTILSYLWKLLSKLQQIYPYNKGQLRV